MRFIMSRDKSIIVEHTDDRLMSTLQTQYPDKQFFFYAASKCKAVDNKLFRQRRGVWVEIPKEWIGQIPTKRTMRKRNTISRRTRKNKNKST